VTVDEPGSGEPKGPPPDEPAPKPERPVSEPDSPSSEPERQVPEPGRDAPEPVERPAPGPGQPEPQTPEPSEPSPTTGPPAAEPDRPADPPRRWKRPLADPRIRVPRALVEILSDDLRGFSEVPGDLRREFQAADLQFSSQEPWQLDVAITGSRDVSALTFVITEWVERSGSSAQIVVDSNVYLVSPRTPRSADNLHRWIDLQIGRLR
jgi:hypothetical protein